jgi:hypothetical protein
MAQRDLSRDLWDLECIKQLKARYFRYVDTKQWHKLRDCFTDDCSFEGLWAGGEDADAFVHSISTNLAEVPTAHAGYMPEIELTGPDTARGIWAMTDYLEWQPDTMAYRGFAVPGQRGIRGYGHYQEEYRRTENDWRISFLTSTRIRIDPLLGDREPVHTNFVPSSTDEWLPSRAIRFAGK